MICVGYSVSNRGLFLQAICGATDVDHFRGVFIEHVPAEAEGVG